MCDFTFPPGLAKHCSHDGVFMAGNVSYNGPLWSCRHDRHPYFRNMKHSRSEFLDIRNLRLHVRHWGEEGAPKLFMLHGWMDMSASFQFVVDSLERDWHVIAPDWRGFGLSQSSGNDTYWFPDYLADLEAILDHYTPSEPAKVVGHSLGGNVASVYAGVRRQRIARLVSLEGGSLLAGTPEQLPGRYAQWLDECRNPPYLRSYASQKEVAERLQANNPRLTPERAAFLAQHWAGPNERGEWEVRADPAHRHIAPNLYRIDEVFACWSSITAPVLMIAGEFALLGVRLGDPAKGRAEIELRTASIPNSTIATVAGAGHMLQHDQPEEVARLIEGFMSA